LGGLGLRDPCILNDVMGAKIWWRWLTHPSDLWARLWRKKYTLGIKKKRLIRFNDHHNGSLIWNATWNNQSLIKDNSFWEV
jgi:hypothetical protein